MPELIKVAIYIRLSLEDSDVRLKETMESESIANQRRFLIDYLTTKVGLHEEEVLEYSDDGFSGTNFERPGFMKLLEDVRRGRIHTIVVKDFSRLGRNYLETGRYLDKVFPAYNIRFISVNDGYDSNDHLGKTTGLNVGFMNVVNDMYSRDISIKNKSAKMVRYKRGEYLNGQVFYGYEHDPENKYHVIPDPAAKRIVQLIFSLCVEGKSTYQIAQILNERQEPSPYEYKKRKGILLNTPIVGERCFWTGSTVRSILKDERYLGKMVSRRHASRHIGSKKTYLLPREEYIVVDNVHQAIVTEELFQQANNALMARAPGKNRKMEERRVNLFYCAYCLHKLYRVNCSLGDEWYCGYRKESLSEECEQIRISGKEIMEKVTDILEVLAKLCFKTTVKSGIAQEQQERFLIKEKRRLYEQYRSQSISKEAFIAEKLRLDGFGSDAKQEKETQEYLALIHRIKEADCEPKELAKLIERIYVYAGGEVEIVFRCRDLWNFST